MTLAGAVAALAALTGVAAVAAPGDEAGRAPAAAARKPVERSTLVCPKPTESDVAETVYSAVTPKGGAAKGGTAELYPAESAETGTGSGTEDGSKGKGAKDEGGQAVLPLKSPGTPVTSTTSRSDAPALIGSAEGRFAPGWTVQQTTEVSAGAGKGLHGTACSVPDTDFWFPATSTAKDRKDYVHLTNPDSTGATVDLDLYGKDGRVSTSSGEAINVPPRSTVPVLLSTLTEEPVTNATLHVSARTGRVGAQVQSLDEKLGGDWIAPAADAAPSTVLPGIPGDAASVRLVVHAPGDRDADLKVRFAGPSGRITPAGYETLHVRGGMTTAVDLKNLAQGEAGTLELTPAEKDGATPVVAGLRVTRGKGGGQESAFVPATRPVDARATAVGDSGREPRLTLTATGKTAKVRVTTSAGSDGGSPASRTYEVKGGTTKSFAPPAPKGVRGSYGVTVERLSGGPLYAARTLTGGGSAFTVQGLPDDRGTVSVPRATQDLSVLNDD
nr:DUF5719 family protein [Streptomyces sp. HNM0574]